MKRRWYWTKLINNLWMIERHGSWICTSSTSGSKLLSAIHENRNGKPRHLRLADIWKREIHQWGSNGDDQKENLEDKESHFLSFQQNVELCRFDDKISPKLNSGYWFSVTFSHCESILMIHCCTIGWSDRRSVSASVTSPQQTNQFKFVTKFQTWPSTCYCCCASDGSNSAIRTFWICDLFCFLVLQFLRNEWSLFSW
jgi:hypothetical protein